ncbi:MAG: hybrid sensor histidine kinase/response regulator [Anaerolineales bacterium]|nr:hybrid sensor histidine kinase/response regulator [Anaerolineales bacterium]
MNKAKILIIDDETPICEAIQRVLTPLDFQVAAALTGEEGLRKIRTNGYDLALIDIMLPGIGGIELISAIHEYDPEIVCIIITGYATVELAVLAIKGGAYNFLTKPFSVDDLLLTVNQGIERRRLSLEAKRVANAEAEAHRLSEEKNRLQELYKAKCEFIRLVTHELQAPIDAIQNYLQLIKEGYIPAGELNGTIDKCLVRAEEERALIADLLELGCLQVITPAQITLVSLSEVLQPVLLAFQEQASQKKIALSIDIPEKVPHVRGVPNQFKSMWLNLISNAIKYTPENGKVTVHLLLEGSNLVGEVSDTGIGIPIEDQPRLFTEFFRAKNAKKLEIRGTGLGLVIVKRVIESTGGSIAVQSKAGRGSTFRFVIPVAKEK